MNATDASDINAAMTSYTVRADITLNRVVDGADLGVYTGDGAIILGRGAYSFGPGHSQGGGHRFAFTGREIHFEDNNLYDMRNRSLRSDLGIWTRRDPLGYVDGPNLYGYVMAPIGATDPMGLCATCGGSGPAYAGGIVYEDMPDDPDFVTHLLPMEYWIAGGPADPNPDFTYPYPKTPCDHEGREAACKRWATQQCARKLGCSMSAQCCQECIDTAMACCLGEECNKAEAEKSCFNKGALAMARCNSAPTDDEWKACWYGCMGAAMDSACGTVCDGCGLIGDPRAVILGCMSTCGLIKLRGLKKEVQPQYWACVGNCVVYGELAAYAICMPCLICIMRSWEFCLRQCDY